MNIIAEGDDNQKRRRISQTEIPGVSLEQALRVPNAIAQSLGKRPSRPIEVASALEMSPTSGTFRSLCGASIGYGLTDGGPNAALIKLTEIGARIVAPLSEGDDTRALREAILMPSVEKEFLERYDGSPLPNDNIGKNVLEAMGVPPSASDRVLKIIVENARFVRVVKSIKNKIYVDLEHIEQDQASGWHADLSPELFGEDDDENIQEYGQYTSLVPKPKGISTGDRKVFVSHGKSRRVVDQLKELLNFGDFEPIVSVERESVSIPISDKVLGDMRLCSAGIIHVRPEERVLDSGGHERGILNENVLIEIGAAMALYGNHLILLVEDGTQLPSNLSGLYEVRYSGDELGYEATMKVLKALNQFKATAG